MINLEGKIVPEINRSRIPWKYDVSAYRIVQFLWTTAEVSVMKVERGG